jgi:hypothetical protein
MANLLGDNEKYRMALQLREGELNRLFQRVSFFLVSTAFLIAALVALVTSKSFSNSIPLNVFAYMLTSIGLILSIMFTIANYLNDMVIRKIIELIKDIAADNLPKASIGRFYELIKNDKPGPMKLLGKFCCDLFKVFSNLTSATEITAPHVWLIPFLFVFFWVG